MIMGMTLTNDFQAHITVENMKASMLNIFIEMFADAKVVMDEDAKDYVVTATEKLMVDNKMDSSLSVSKYKATSDTDGKEEFFVKMEEFDEVSDLFRTAIAKMMIQVISYDLSEHLDEREKEE